jgi:phosphate transport system protein
LFNRNKIPRKTSKSVEAYLYSTDRERIINMQLDMGLKAARAITDSVSAIISEDVRLAQRIVDSDDEIDAMEQEIDLECLRSIAMRQPVREELRLIFAVLKTITDLERIGDQAVNIAKWAIYLSHYPKVETNPVIPSMGQIVDEMLRAALSAFKVSDADMALAICDRDDELDRMYSDVFEEFVNQMASHPTGDTQAVRIAAGQMWVARHLERVGDHITNIAERVYFMSKGEELKKKMFHIAGR